MITIALFNNKGGVGKTTLAYHLTYMFQRLGYGVLAVDLDPQANLTSAFFDDDTLEKVWDENVFGRTVLTCVQPILDGTGDIAPAVPLRLNPVDVLCGDLGLSRFEDKLSESWPKGFANDQAALRATSAFYRMIQDAGVRTQADIVLVDVGPNLGAINRSALLAADFLLVPLASDLFSLQGLKNLGPTVREWRASWEDMLARAKVNFALPPGRMQPLGYVMLQHAVRADRPAKWYEKWLQRVPGATANRSSAKVRNPRFPVKTTAWEPYATIAVSCPWPKKPENPCSTSPRPTAPSAAMPNWSAFANAISAIWLKPSPRLVASPLPKRPPTKLLANRVPLICPSQISHDINALASPFTPDP